MDTGCIYSTPLPCEIEDRTITITGACGIAVITAPENTEIRLDTFPEAPGSPVHNRIAIHKKGRSGILEVMVKLLAKDEFRQHL